MQTEVTLTKTPITAVLESRCHQFDHDEEGNITGCLRSYDMEPTALNIGPNIYGIAMRFNEGETLNAVFLPDTTPPETTLSFTEEPYILNDNIQKEVLVDSMLYACRAIIVFESLIFPVFIMRMAFLSGMISVLLK